MEAFSNSFVTSCLCFGAVGAVLGFLVWRAQEGSKLARQGAWVRGHGWRAVLGAGGVFLAGWCACFSLLLVPTDGGVDEATVVAVALPTAEAVDDVTATAVPALVGTPVPLGTATEEAVVATETATVRPTLTAVPSATSSPAPTETPSATSTPLPTATAAPSSTPLPTAVPSLVPTNTAAPLPTATAVPANTAVPQPTATAVPLPRISVTSLNKQAEYADIRNNTAEAIDLNGWVLVSELGPQRCPLGGVLEAGQTLRVWAMAEDSGEGGFNCGFGSNIWNNDDYDAAVIIDPNGVEVHRR